MTSINSFCSCGKKSGAASSPRSRTKINFKRSLATSLLFFFSPKKNFKEFGVDSDLDLIIVSKYYYKKIWSAYRKISQESYLQNFNTKTGNIFNGFIGIKDSDNTYGNQDLIDWQQLVRTFKAELQLRFDINHELNYRIYADWESVQDYHMRGINKLKEGIVKSEIKSHKPFN